MPTDEELAYSVLKSKLTKNFRDAIEEIHEEYGLATQSRIAHLAIRLFESLKKQSFYGGSVFSAVMDLCKEEMTAGREEFFTFVSNGRLNQIVKEVCSNTKLTKWHLTRYATERNGDVFLFMMLVRATELKIFRNFNLDGIAELIFCYSNQTDYAIRKILDEGLQIGFARLLRETYYGTPRFFLPINPSEYKPLKGDSTPVAIAKWKSSHTEAAVFMSQGYGGSPYNRSLSVLIYACKNSPINNYFEYNKWLGVWSEENCPWDYDHIMPRSTIEKMPEGDMRNLCEWLKNSIGNIAPIPFSINRSLSDLARNNCYPFCDQPERTDVVEQRRLCVRADAVARMWTDGMIVPKCFATATVNRFIKIYNRWYYGLRVNRILDFKVGFQQCCATSRIAKEVIKRYNVFTLIRKDMPRASYRYIADDNTEPEIPKAELYRYFAAEDHIVLSIDEGDIAVAVCKSREGDIWEVGLRKGASVSKTVESVRTRIKDLTSTEGACKKNEWWYLLKEFPDKEDVGQCILKHMNSLLEKIFKIGLK